MIWLLVLGLVAAVSAAVFIARWRSPDATPNRITPPAQRILFPFIGETVSRSALDASLRLARAEGATLVPAYIVTVPMRLSLEAPVPQESERAMPLLEAIEQRAARMKVPVDSRIEVGRAPRQTLLELVRQERFDRLVVPAATQSTEGFSADDIAWLLEHAPGEIVVLRPKNGDKKEPRLQQDAPPGSPKPRLPGEGNLAERIRNTLR
jgi:nucleotide-binding universal stress UspA family protein